ncbi:MAG: SCO family protein [Opitutaceae bacterium]
MKTRASRHLIAVLAAAAAFAAETAPPCCPPDTKPAAAPCCPVVPPAAPLSSRSLYQLDAKWTDDAGGTVSLASLRGQPVIVAMFFASCEYACPVLVSDIQRLRTQLPPADAARTRVVLVTFDTERDTLAALRAFRERSGLDANWTLLRGEDTAVQELAMLLGVKFRREARGQFAHSNLFTLLNADGEIAHQTQGLMGDVSPAARVLAALPR